MLVALEVNFALWIMIGCGIAEIAQFVGYQLGEQPLRYPDGDPTEC